MRPLQPPPWLRLLGPAVLVLPVLFAPSTSGTVADPGGWDLLVVVLTAAVVALRRTFPRTAVLGGIALCLVALLLEGPFLATATGLLVVVFSLARHTDRRTAVPLIVAAAAAVGIGVFFLLSAQWGAWRSLFQVVVLVGFVGAAGDATRSRHAYIEAITERARRAEETLESEARSRVAEERLRIARDLHDVMAHQIAVINLHASVASQALRTRPDDAERSLSTIRDAARTVLGEIGSLLHVLREPGAALTSAPAGSAPVPGLAQLERLVDEFSRSGLRVDLRVVGRATELPEAVDIAAYRIIQEGLTNALKHGSDGSALLHLQYDDEQLEIVVVNAVDRSPRGAGGGSRAGHGLLGARERVSAVHGDLETGFGPGQVHRLTARLPRSGVTSSR